MDSAYYFREKAARCRLLLAVATNPEVREQLRLWVWEFEDRADSAERRGQRRQRMRAGWRRLRPLRFGLAVMRGVHVQLHRQPLADKRYCRLSAQRPSGQALEIFVGGHRLRARKAQRIRRVILKIAADLRRIDHHRNIQVRQVIGWPDTREHQKLGRVNGAPAQDDLALRPDRLT